MSDAPETPNEETEALLDDLYDAVYSGNREAAVARCAGLDRSRRRARYDPV